MVGGFVFHSNRCVQQVCRELLCSGWLTKKEGNVLQLLECFDVETYPEETHSILESALGCLDLTSSQVMSRTPQPPYTADELRAEKVGS